MTIWYPASCSRDDVNDYAGDGAFSGSVLDEDVVHLPSCSGSDVYTSQITITKAITIEGNGCTLDGNNRPTSCNTIITDNVVGGAAFAFLLVADKTSRITGIEIRSGADKVNPYYWVYVQGQGGGGAQDGRRFRVDHMRFYQLQGWHVTVVRAWGVIDHNYMEAAGRQHFYVYNTNDYDYADARWSESLASSPLSPTGWGTDKAVFIENNTITRSTGAPFYAALDGYGGSRVVSRFNDITNSWLEGHGSESSSRARGTRSNEVYKNVYVSSTGDGSEYLNNRSGPSLVWGNTGSGYSVTPAAVKFNNERTLGGQLFNGGDGTGKWDVNDPSNPFFGPYTVQTGETPTGGDVQQTLTFSGTPFSGLDFTGYHAHIVGCQVPLSSDRSCGLIVRSNTDNEIIVEFVNAPNTGQHQWLDIVDGVTQIDLRKITHVFDAPGRSTGTLLVSIPIASSSNDGATATINTSSAHNLALNDWVNLSGSGGGEWFGTHQVSEIVDSDSFKFVMEATPGSGLSSGEVTGNPVTDNDQVTDPCYQWLNLHGSTSLVSNPHYYPYDIRSDEHYYDYDPAKTFDGTIASNRSSIGVGFIGSRPATCTTGVAYWATDEGSWNLSGSGGQGQLYKCTAPNTWTLYYTPYTYPYPGTEESAANLSQKGAAFLLLSK